MNEREISPCSLTLCIAEYGNYSVCLSYIMIVLYIWWYQCNVACSTMCTERLVRLTIDGYVLLVAHIIRRCTTCSIENSRLCRGIKTIVYTLNYYTRILVSSFPLRLYFSRNFFLSRSYSRRGLELPEGKAKLELSAVYVSLSWRETSLLLKKIELSRSVRSCYCNQTRHSSKNNYSFSRSGRNSKVWICKSWPSSLSRSSSFLRLLLLSFLAPSFLAKFVELTL